MSTMVDEVTEALMAANSSVRREYQGPDLREAARGPAPQGGWQPIVDRRSDNQLVRDGVVLRPGESVCHRCWTVVTPTGECYC